VNTAHSGHAFAHTWEAAPYYLAKGFLPIPIPFRKKGAVLEHWEDLRPTTEELPRLFPEGEHLNVGLLLGAPSGGLVDVDLDSVEAVRAAAHLPPRGWIHGRPGKPKSHYWFIVADPPAKASAKFKDPDKGYYTGDGPAGDADKLLLLELRSTGGQTVVPPSIHPSGEPLVWHVFNDPVRVSRDELRVACCQVAAAALLARHWPAKGCRHELALALAGGLLRAGWTTEKTEGLLRAVYETAQTGDVEAKLRAV